jgi:hypothetical protein
MGGACTNKVRVRRDRVEKIILDPIRDDLLSPEVVEQMASEMRKQQAVRLNKLAEKADAASAEVQAISDRIANCANDSPRAIPTLSQTRFRSGPNRSAMNFWTHSRPRSNSAKMIALLPKGAESYRRRFRKTSTTTHEPPARRALSCASSWEISA